MSTLACHIPLLNDEDLGIRKSMSKALGSCLPDHSIPKNGHALLRKRVPTHGSRNCHTDAGAFHVHLGTCSGHTYRRDAESNQIRLSRGEIPVSSRGLFYKGYPSIPQRWYGSNALKRQKASKEVCTVIDH
ncbi:hypothetical protein [Promicromonospora sp. AC04]|uniref:hypothetical protein n=1 Tax=Promicromonospora sp. AC04 TaxID=2135723 RepID=UPI0011B23529|nr:hypothetical protein [Promicromonospora sp. AC04]